METQFEYAVKKQEEIENLKKQIRKHKECISNVLDTLYTLEDIFDYDETDTGLKIGGVINKLQNNFIKE